MLGSGAGAQGAGRCSPERGYKWQEQPHTDRLFSAAAAAPGAAFTPALPHCSRGPAGGGGEGQPGRNTGTSQGKKKLNREIKIKFKCHAGSSKPPAQSWCHPRHRASRLGTAGSCRAGARCFLHAGVKTNSCRFSEPGPGPGVLPGEKAAAVKAAEAAPGEILLLQG